ncbi:cytochrome P450 [Mycena floridula]|nr:cytochrome P450 [Mycena floridula]
MNTISLILSLLLLFVLTKLYDRGRRAKRDLPPLGFPSVWKSYVTSISNGFRSNAAVQTACMEYGERLFTFSLMGQWVVLAQAKMHILDIIRAPEEVLSMEAAAEDLLQLQHTVGAQFCTESYHIAAIRTSLNQNLAAILPDIIDEIVCGFDEVIGPQCGNRDGWFSIDVMETFSRIISRASNRVFVGLPLCRNDEYCRLVSGFTSSVLSAGPPLRFLVPGMLRPLLGSVFRAIHGHHRRMLKLLRPLLTERMRIKGNKELPNDMLTWLIEAAPSAQKDSPESLAMRMLNVNFVALHTTTKTFTHTVYNLAANPSYIPILRKEAELYLGTSDPRLWSKEALARCVKMDSFLKETLRLNGLGAIWMPRRAVTDFTFSDGTKIPTGHFVANAATAIHENETLYPRPKEFQGLRFAELAEQQNEAQLDENSEWPHRLTGTSTSFLAFGGGRHLCPGRYFTSLQMKCLLAHLVLRYDVKTSPEGVRPADEWFGPTSGPARGVRVLFKKRDITKSC